MKHLLRTISRPMVATVLLACAGCGGGVSDPNGSLTPPPLIGSTATASGKMLTSPLPAPNPPPTDEPCATASAAITFDFVYQSRRVCLSAGATLTIQLPPNTASPWTIDQVPDSHTLGITSSQSHPDGSMTVSGYAMHPGSTTATFKTAPVPQMRVPPGYTLTLDIKVVPA